MRYYALAILLLLSPAILLATTIHVPADQPSIQAGIDATSAGDTVLVASGTYHEYDIVIDKGIVLCGQNSDPSMTIIDAEGYGRVMLLENVDSMAEILNLTMSGGSSQTHGGGIRCSESHVNIRNCIIRDNQTPGFKSGGGISITLGQVEIESCMFRNNVAGGHGGGLSIDQTDAIVVGCIFKGNYATSGGGLYLHSSSSVMLVDLTIVGNIAEDSGGGVCHESSQVDLVNSTIIQNSAQYGGGIAGSTVYSGSTLSMVNSILAFNTQGSSVFCAGDSNIDITCSDVFGNAGGDWVGCVSDQDGQNGNISENPQFCDLNTDDYNLETDSPCSPGNNDCGVLMGAWLASCDIRQWAVEAGGNGHYYLLVQGSHRWDEALTLAQEYSWAGLSGYLTTITSAAESDWICSQFPGRFWLGGYQPEGSEEPDGGWEWVTEESWEYTSWRLGEPNDADGAENSLHRWPGECDGTGDWNDSNGSNTIEAFLVEFGESEEEISWPDNTALPALVLKIEEDSGEHKVHSVDLKWGTPHPGSGRKKIGSDDIRDTELVDDDGFVVFELGSWDDDFVDSIELNDIDGNKIGHIGFKITHEFDELALNAFIFLHDQYPGFPWVPGQDPPGWSPIHENWDYYDEGEYPVSMLVPPGFNIENVRQANEKPVLFVHGIAGYFNYWDGTPEAAVLPEDTYDTWRYCYPYDQPIQASGELLGKAIERLLHGDLVGVSDYQTQRADLVAHSMGGLVSRSWIQSDEYQEIGQVGDRGNVNTLLMFATPNHGSHVSYRLHDGENPLENIGEILTTHDGEAPAHKQMTPASTWIMDMNASPIRSLGRGSSDALGLDYLVIAGTKDVNGIPHTEITNQDDEFVAVSSASMLPYRIPLALVDGDHWLHKADGAPTVVAAFLSSGYDPSAPGFPIGDDEWVYEFFEELGDIPTPRTEEYDASAGILELNLAWVDEDLDRLALIPYDEHLVLQDHSFTRLRRSSDGESGFFTRFLANFPFDYEIGIRIPRREYAVQYEEREWSWWPFPPGWKWIPRGTCPETIRFEPLCTTSATLSMPISGLLACGAPNATPLEPIDFRSCEYGLFIDSSIDTIVFSLSSLDELPDYYQHGMILEDPYGQIIDPAVAQSDPQIGFFENLDFGPLQYVVEHPDEGYWIVRHEESVLTPIVMAYTYGDLSTDLSVSPHFCAAGDTIFCEVQTSGIESYPESNLYFEGFYSPPNSTEPVSMGEILLDDLGMGIYRAQLLEVTTGEYLFHLGLTCVTVSGDTIRLSDCGSAFVTTDETPVQPDDPEDDDGQSPDIQTTQLLGAWPNPFNPSIKVELYNAREQRIRVAVYDITGRRIRQLLDKEVPVGRLSVDWDGIDENENSVPSGVYLIQFQAKGLSDSRKVVLLK